MPRKNRVTMVSLVAITTACSSTPQHTNTLIFGTNTIIALDVSQAPTGNVGVTVGYKRQEAVWMPLLANESGTDGNLTPSKCEADTCRSFVGETGVSGVNGNGARDTYSVIATLSGDSSAKAPSPASGASVSAGGTIAQFFATGIAARLLADKGGAAVVNTNARPAVAEELQQRVNQELATRKSVINTVTAHVSKPDGTLDNGSLETLVSAVPTMPANIRTSLLGSKDVRTVRELLDVNYDAAAKPLFVAIK